MFQMQISVICQYFLHLLGTACYNNDFIIEILSSATFSSLIHKVS